MAELVDDCPRCQASQITFDVLSDHVFEVNYGWQRLYEAFCRCRRCHRATVFVLRQKINTNDDALASLASLKGALNDVVSVEGFINLKDIGAASAPEYLPPNLAPPFAEGAKCLAIGCYNAAGVMFRLCVDLGTQPLLPASDDHGLNAKIRRDLGLRLPWLFERKLLPEELHALSKCVKDDGNDGAHKGTLGKPEAEDLQEFTFELLERLYTLPAKVKAAEERTRLRRAKPLR